MTLTERERQAVERGNARGCIMCRRIVEAQAGGAIIGRDGHVLYEWTDGVVTFDVSGQKFHVECEVRYENAKAREKTK